MSHLGEGRQFLLQAVEQARFVHDPDAGSAPWQRLKVSHMPEQPAVGRGRRAPTWMEELAHLETLARKPATVAADGKVAEEPAEEASPADQLAAYLLSRVDLNGV